MQTFPITQVNALRTAAAGACGEPVDAPLGWSVSRLDPMEMLSVFSSIWLRPGLVLRAYQLQYLGNGRGVVWALPITAAFPEPEPE
ncbi:hypothetical protein LOC68_24680 [Blastopirellula sp. JC732]|uniref:Uncharacterized protein n=1 Tax=Blastopirellula sediminis TaxID=2894196 RepID=A0A9X1MSD3_9BACT|nr:hypothetical protein [Blastopirellula sediminis]MCC9605095.1 hypothetical protein [Blastopirellula sediminis]MCC9631605.1 hypothetical protein [Blastopirellula sediminis]